MGGIILVSSFLLQSLLAHAGRIAPCTHFFLPSQFIGLFSGESLLGEFTRRLKILVPVWVARFQKNWRHVIHLSSYA